MDTNDNKGEELYIPPRNLLYRRGQLLVADDWLCSRFNIPFSLFSRSIEGDQSIHRRWNRAWIDAEHFSQLLSTPLAAYFHASERVSVLAMLRGKWEG